MEGQELFQAREWFMYEEPTSWNRVLTVLRRKLLHKDARLHLLSQDFMVLHCIKPESWHTFFFCSEAL